MPEPKIIAEFPTCPDCGSKVTVAQLAVAPFKESGKIPKEAFAALRKEIIPLEQPVLATIAVPCRYQFRMCPMRQRALYSRRNNTRTSTNTNATVAWRRSQKSGGEASIIGKTKG